MPRILYSNILFENELAAPWSPAAPPRGPHRLAEAFVSALGPWLADENSFLLRPPSAPFDSPPAGRSSGPDQSPGNYGELSVLYRWLDYLDRTAPARGWEIQFSAWALSAHFLRFQEFLATHWQWPRLRLVREGARPVRRPTTHHRQLRVLNSQAFSQALFRTGFRQFIPPELKRYFQRYRYGRPPAHPPGQFSVDWLYKDHWAQAGRGLSSKPRRQSACREPRLDILLEFSSRFIIEETTSNSRQKISFEGHSLNLTGWHRPDSSADSRPAWQGSVFCRSHPDLPLEELLTVAKDLFPDRSARLLCIPNRLSREVDNLIRSPAWGEIFRQGVAHYLPGKSGMPPGSPVTVDMFFYRWPANREGGIFWRPWADLNYRRSLIHWNEYLSPGPIRQDFLAGERQYTWLKNPLASPGKPL